MEILTGVVRDRDDVLDFPEPITLFKGFGESSLDFALRFWTKRFERWIEVSSEVTLAVHNALYDAGIQIPFPQRDLHVKSVEPKAAEALKPPTAPRTKPAAPKSTPPPKEK